MTFPFVGTHTARDWGTWGGRNHDIDDDGVTLATADRRQYVSPTALVGEPPLPFSVVDIDVDDCGDVWLLAADGTLRRYDPDRDDLRRLNCTWDAPPAAPRGIAVTEDTVYVVVGASADADGGAAPDADATRPRPGRIHAFSRQLMQTRWVADEAYTDPVSLARHGEMVSVLDRGDDTTEPFLATVGRGGAPDATTTGFRSPTDLAVDDAGSRYVLDGAADGSTPTIERVRAGEMTVETAVPTSQFETDETGTALTPGSLAAGRSVGQSHPSELLVGTADALPDEHALFRHQLAPGNFERLTTYTGPVDALLLRRDAATRTPGLYVVGHPGTALSFLPAAERTRLNPATGRYDAQLVTRLDAGEDEVQWHRLTASLDTTEPGTQVRISYRATDDASMEFPDRGSEAVTPLERVTGIGETTADRLRAASVHGLRELVRLPPDRLAALVSTPTYAVSTSDTADWVSQANTILETLDAPGSFGWQPLDPADPRDALFEDAVGRYLWVKVELIGTASAAPRIGSLRAYFPRQSYLRYLPAVYREDPRSAAFLERFLSLFESVFTGVEEEISAATRYLDPDGVPGEALSWLGGWLALAPDDTWATADERALLRAAPALFKRRGTRRGLVDLLSIYLDDPTFPPRWEWAVTKQQAALTASVGDENGLSEATATRLADRLDRKLYVWEQQDLSCIDDPVVRTMYEKFLPCPQCFAVMVWPFIGDDRLREVERLVATTTPAHASGNVIPLYPSLRLTGADGDTGYNTFLGLNSVLVDRDFAVGSSDLGTDTELTESEPSGQLGSAHRLGTDTRLS